MPAPYSLDLRRKAVLAYEEGEGTQQEIAQQFDIGLRTLKEWIFIKKETGDVLPKEHVHRGQLPIINHKGLLFIKKTVENKPDILISNIEELYSKKFKVKVAQSMISRALKKLNLRRKKKSEYAIEQERDDVKKNEKNGKKK
jgi:transposase